MKAIVGRVLATLSGVIAVVGLLVNGISIELIGIILGAGGYALGLSGDDRASRLMGIAAIALNIVAIVVGGLGVPESYEFPPVPG